jgi:hypothetical protein
MHAEVSSSNKLASSSTTTTSMVMSEGRPGTAGFKFNKKTLVVLGEI